MTLANFQANLPILQKYLTQNKYWKNQNKQGQKSQFMEHFFFTKWTKLDEKERKEHTIENCNLCNTVHLAADGEELQKNIEEITSSLIDTKSPMQNSRDTEGFKILKYSSTCTDHCGKRRRTFYYPYYDTTQTFFQSNRVTKLQDI